MKKLLFLTILIFGIYLTINNLWAEPSPESERVSPAFYVRIKCGAKEHEVELKIETIEKDLSDEELELLAKCIEAEAGNQDLLGKKFVCDVILNRVDSEIFPNEIEEVIKQPNQFSVISNGSIDKVALSEDTWTAIYEELNNRSNSEILYFQTGGYSKYGEPYKKVGDHYFSRG